MRSARKGQQFDRLWVKLNNISDLLLSGSEDYNKMINELETIKAKVKTKEPTSDYEAKDKANLLNQIYKVNQLLNENRAGKQ